MDLISIIIPVYNSRQYLEKCLDSIINQTYSNIEIIIIDDGSTDDSYKICEKYQEIDDRIKIIRTKNNGVSSARNKGIDLSKGKYMTFIDSDDYVEKNYIEELYQTLINNSANCVISSFKQNKNNKIIKYSSNKAIINMLQSNRFDSSTCGKLIDTKLAKDIKFDERLLIAEDLYFYYNCFKECKTIIYTNYCGYNYIIHSGSAINSISNKKIKNLSIFEELLANEKEKSIKNAIMSKYISTTFHFLSLCDQTDAQKELIEIIKKYRKKCIFKSNISFKVRVACALSYLSFRFFIKK